MTIEIINDTEKVVKADEGKVLTNGGDFAQYPTELICNIDDESWYEIEAPEIIIENELP